MFSSVERPYISHRWDPRSNQLWQQKRGEGSCSFFSLFSSSCFFIRTHHVMSIVDHPIRSGHHVYIYIYNISTYFSLFPPDPTSYIFSIFFFLFLHLDSEKKRFAFGKGKMGEKKNRNDNKSIVLAIIGFRWVDKNLRRAPSCALLVDINTLGGSPSLQM
jgi:hypothetical protein